MAKKLNLGCGRDIKEGYVNLDWSKRPGVDVVHDLNKFPYPFKDNTFDEVACNHVLVLVDEVVKTMEELHRICKNGAVIKVFDLYYNCSGAHNDPYIKRLFNENSFNYLEKDYETGFYTDKKFKILKRELIPTRFGRLFPKFMRKTAGIILGEVHSNVRIDIQVIK